MSRSNGKFLPLYINDLKIYFNKLTQDTKPKLLRFKRNRTITVWNSVRAFKLYQGRYWQIFKGSELHLNFKYGEFSKTRKPFFFRSKKKR